VKALLAREYAVKSATFEKVSSEADAMALKLRDDVLAMGRPDPISMFEHAYAAQHPLIDEGRREMVELGISQGVN
jgi:pyruvate dehydrogenase E1 component alpha subunit